MKKYIFSEIRKLAFPFFAVVILGVLCNYFLIRKCVESSEIWCWLTPWLSGTDILDLIFPLLVSAPFVWQVFFEAHGNYLQYIGMRMSRKKYLAVKGVVTALVSGISTIIINISGVVFSNRLSVGAAYSAENDFYIRSNFLGSMQYGSPLLYAALLISLRFVIAVLFCLMGYILSMALDNIFVALTAPFVYSILENFVTAIFGTPQLSITTAINPNRLAADAISFASLAAGPAMLFAVILIIGFTFNHNIPERLHE